MLLEFTEYPFKAACLENELYHHSEKGCVIQVLFDKRISVNKQFPIRYLRCLTHGCNCSRTGWLFGHYGGDCSRDIWKE